MELYGVEIASRLLLGTAQYPSPAILADAVRAARADIVTVSLRRESGRLREGQDFWSLIRALGIRILPNTAGCHSAKEAVTTAQMARELFATDWVKLEVIANDDTLQPDVFGLVEAARVLTEEGFEVFPYTTEDLAVARALQRKAHQHTADCGHGPSVAQIQSEKVRGVLGSRLGRRRGAVRR